jgi:hypothetical protein
VPESSITVFDSSRFIPGNLYDKIHHEFPGVTFVDHIGGDGRVKAEFKPNVIPFSIESNNAKGLDTTVVEAAYLVDAAVLRAHVSSGVTLCAKNLFGATSINTDWRKNAHDGFHHNNDGSASYSAFTDRLSMILNATASGAAALAYTNIGTMGQTRSTRAISEKRTGSNFSKSKVRNILEPPLPLIRGVAQLQIGFRDSGRQDEPKSVFLMLRSGIDATGNCVFPIILEPV